MWYRKGWVDDLCQLECTHQLTDPVNRQYRMAYSRNERKRLELRKLDVPAQASEDTRYVVKDMFAYKSHRPREPLEVTDWDKIVAGEYGDRLTGGESDGRAGWDAPPWDEKRCAVVLRIDDVNRLEQRDEAGQRVAHNTDLCVIPDGVGFDVVVGVERMEKPSTMRVGELYRMVLQP